MANPIQSSDTVVTAALMESAAAVPVPKLAPSDAFLLRASLAARRAAELRGMADVAETTGFQPLPLPDYLAAIAVAAKVSLSRVLPNLTGQLLEPWVQLGRDIALPTKRLRLLVRAFVAAREAPAATPVFARASSITGSTPLIGETLSEHEFTARLARIESSYPAETRQRLDDTLSAMGLQNPPKP